MKELSGFTEKDIEAALNFSMLAESPSKRMRHIVSSFLPFTSPRSLIHDMTNKKFKEVYHEAMTEIYKASIPSASWDDLLRDSPRNEAGQIEIPFENYHISDQILDEIIQVTAKKYRLSQNDLESLRTTVYLGPSPLSIRPKS